MMQQQTIIVSVTNDLETDQRVHKVCTSLINNGFKVLLVGRKLATSSALQRNYATKRFKLWFSKGPAFYLNYNFRLFTFLLFNKNNLLIANDLDALPANFLISKIKKIPLIYDSHELFTEVPELINRPFKQKIWETIEAWILPKIKHSYTVSNQIKNYYFEKYGTNMELIRNFPRAFLSEKEYLPRKENIILYQGALNVDRGLEELIEAMQYLENAKLQIAGSGDIELKLKEICKKLDLESKVFFLGRIPLEKLMHVTLKAKLGLSIEKNSGLNYQFALPNKIFDYIQAGVPVLYAGLTEVKNTLADFEVGEELKSIQPKELAKQINAMLKSPKYDKWVENCSAAAKQFNWEKEELKLISIIKQLV